MLSLSSKHPTRDLQGYAAFAKLPEMKHSSGGRQPPQMPPPGHKSHRNLLHVRPEVWRNLALVLRMRQDDFAKLVGHYHKSFPRSVATTDAAATSGFCLAADGFDVRPMTLIRPSTVTKVSHWVEMIVLQTAQNILHYAFPFTKQWIIHSDEEHHRDVDSSLMKQIVWFNSDTENTPEGYQTNLNGLMVFVQPPWVLSPKDFQQFVSRRKVNAVHKQFDQPEAVLKSSERVWAKLWDACADAQCHWFVITSYGQWAFGVFSEGWTIGFISPPIAYDAQRPNVVQCLSYWMMSAIGAPGGFTPPQMPEAVTNAVNQIPMHPNVGKKKMYFREQIDSDSEWEGQEEEPGSQHGSQYHEMEDMSDITLQGESRPNEMQKIKGLPIVDGELIPVMDPAERIEEWRWNPLVRTFNVAAHTHCMYKSRGRPVADNASEAGGSESQWSVTGHDQDDVEGDFIVMQPDENRRPKWGGTIPE